MKERFLKWKRATINAPITVNLLLVGFLVWLCFYLLYRKIPAKQEELVDNFQPLVLLMARAALWFVVALVVLSLLSTFFSWWQFRRWNKRGKTGLELNLSSAGIHQNRLQIQPFIRHITRPLLGFISGRMALDHHQFSDKFFLASNKRKTMQLRGEGIFGKSELFFDNVREYQVRGAYVYFEDMLRLISLPVFQPSSGNFYQAPIERSSQPIDLKPRSTETMEVRIDQLRKVDGEFLNYKNFEFGDDVRRIVWKIYGKNRDLVVRRPEIMNPYASHIFMYASFHTALEAFSVTDYAEVMLNYYKNGVWSLFSKVLEKKDQEARYIAEMNLIGDELHIYRERVQRSIAHAEWQSHFPLTQYFDSKKGSLLCVSSLTDPGELQTLLDTSSDEVQIAFMKLSECFNTNIGLTWLKRIFFQSPEQKHKRLKATWILSPFRAQVLRNEEKLQKILQQYGYPH